MSANTWSFTAAEGLGRRIERRICTVIRLTPRMLAWGSIEFSNDRYRRRGRMAAPGRESTDKNVSQLSTQIGSSATPTADVHPHGSLTKAGVASGRVIAFTQAGGAVLEHHHLAIAIASIMVSASVACTKDEGQRTIDLVTSELGPAALLEQCPFKRWESINVIKDFYGITDDPIEEPSPLARDERARSYFRSTYYYLLPQYGVVIRFGADLQMLQIGVRRPFRGQIGGVATGATKDDVRRIRGETSDVWSSSRAPAFLKLQREARTRVLERLADPASHANIFKAVREVGLKGRFPLEFFVHIRGLPDPASKQAVRDILNEVTIIDEASLKYTTDWSYTVGGTMHIHFRFASDDTVEAIFADSCDVK